MDSTAALRARNALSRAVELQPNHGQAWVRLAYTLTYKEMLEPGDLPAFETAHRLAPNDPSGTVNLVLAYARLGQRDRAVGLIEKEVVPRGNPEEIRRAWQAWVNGAGMQAGTLLEHGKLEEAVPILQELARRAPAEHTVQVREQLAEVERALAYNAFVRRYNEGVALANDGKLEEARAIFQELTANPPTPEQAESVRKLIEEIDGLLKARKSVKRKP